MKLRLFTFNLFYENTYILYDESGECVIIDPGCSSTKEEEELIAFIEAEKLKPVRLLNTHCHIDHILGNRFISERYQLPLEAHAAELYNIHSADILAEQFGMRAPQSPNPGKELKEGDTVNFGHTNLQVYFTPGHSAGHVIFYSEADKTIIGGDVLFRESIGRTDLPGGDFAALLKSIQQKLFTLPDDVIVYPGHGPSTRIGYEKENNPFLNDSLV